MSSDDSGERRLLSILRLAEGGRNNGNEEADEERLSNFEKSMQSTQKNVSGQQHKKNDNSAKKGDSSGIVYATQPAQSDLLPCCSSKNSARPTIKRFASTTAATPSKWRKSHLFLHDANGNRAEKTAANRKSVDAILPAGSSPPEGYVYVRNVRVQTNNVRTGWNDEEPTNVTIRAVPQIDDNVTQKENIYSADVQQENNAEIAREDLKRYLTNLKLSDDLMEFCVNAVLK